MLNFFLFLAEGIVLTEARREGDFLGKGPAVFMLTSCASRLLSELFGKGGCKKWIGFYGRG